MKTLIFILSLGLTSTSFAGEIAGGTYVLSGVAMSHWTDWTCSATGWKKRAEGVERVFQKRNYVVRDLGWAIENNETGILKTAFDANSECSFLHADSNYKYRRNSSLVPVINNVPTPCQGKDGKIYTISITKIDHKPFGSCNKGEQKRHRHFEFKHGYELAEDQSLVWNPQAIEFIPNR